MGHNIPIDSTMIVKIEIAFEVTSNDGEDLTENQALDAADLAAYHYLSFVKVSGHSTDSEQVEVRVDGFGPCMVRLAHND